MITIGNDGFGNDILLGVDGENYGKVYFCNRDEIRDEDLWHALGFVANSFEEFVDSMVTYEQAHEKPPPGA